MPMRERPLPVVLGHPDGWQGLDLVLGQLDRDALVDLLNRVDRNGDLLATPEVTFLQENMRHMPVSRVDDQSLHLADLTVARVHGLATPEADLPWWKRVARLDRTGQGQVGVGLTLQAEVGPVIRLMRGVRVIPTATGEEVHLLGGGELLEFGKGVAEADVASAGLHLVERDEAAQATSVLGLNDQVGELASQ